MAQLSKDIVKDILEIEEGRPLNGTEKQEAGKWITKLEEVTGKEIGETNFRFTSINEAADIILHEFPYMELNEFNPDEEKHPPCSIMKSLEAGPLNCVGRIATLVMIDEIRGLSKDPMSNLRLEFDIDYRQKLEGGKEIKNGHITAFIRTGGNKEYLGTSYDWHKKEYPVRMLPATYAVQNAMAIGGMMGEEQRAKQMAQKAIDLGAENSKYLSNLAHKIINY